MKPQLLKVSTAPAHSFSLRQDRTPNVNNRWHYHPEVELVQFHQGSGTQFVGDNIQRFSTGDIVLVGSNLPHYWRYDEVYLDLPEQTEPYSSVIHFNDNFWGDTFLNLPETRAIRSILDRAHRGIALRNKANSRVALLIAKIFASGGLQRMIALLECLAAFADDTDQDILSSIGFHNNLSESEHVRINAIYEYSLSNFKQKIQLDDIAAVAGLVPNSFCRYFKSRTGKTYSTFLAEIRVGHACKLLIDNRISIKQLCFESGFNNFTCFHKNFRDITGKSPQQYQREYLQ